MDEYIKREDLRQAYEESLRKDNHRIEGASAVHAQEHRHILRILDKMPVADVVEVVRCKDCKYCHYEKRWNGEERFGCFRESQFDMNTTYPNHYCSYGERKDQI